MAVNHKAVFSSHVQTIGYDPDTNELHVQYSKGRPIVYRDVPPHVANKVVNAPSIGEALHEHIRDNYGYSYVGP